jgi:diguanylate cyclase (GGDEF)-like protein
MANAGEAVDRYGEPADVERRTVNDARSRERIIADALQGLRAVAADLRADAAESRADPLDPEQILDAARRIERLSADIVRAVGLIAVEGALLPGVGRSPTARPRILVVDDDADLREAMALSLEPAYEVRAAANGEQAVEIARAERPDLILMDQLMPGLDGLGTLERLRSDPATVEIPVILVSARSDEAIRVRALDLGAVDFLSKPFSEQELRARLDRTLRFIRSQSVLRELAETDPLTGLANLRAFRARLDEEVKRARRYRTSLTCVMADMDHLKAINDQLGHAAGDLAIGAVARTIAEELRETDFGARYGGDEFVLLLPHTGGDEGRVFAERLCRRLRESPLSVGGRSVLIAASFGVAELTETAGDDAGDEMVRAADTALYEAKHAGRGRVALAQRPS